MCLQTKASAVDATPAVGLLQCHLSALPNGFRRLTPWVSWSSGYVVFNHLHHAWKAFCGLLGLLKVQRGSVLRAVGRGDCVWAHPKVLAPSLLPGSRPTTDRVSKLAGCVFGAGAGVLVLEEYEHAKARGARIYAEYVGGAFTCDAHHMTEPLPNGAGVGLCLERALAAAGESYGCNGAGLAHAVACIHSLMRRCQCSVLHLGSGRAIWFGKSSGCKHYMQLVHQCQPDIACVLQHTVGQPAVSGHSKKHHATRHCRMMQQIGLCCLL